MYSSGRHKHTASGGAPARETHGLILDQGRRYDLTVWLVDTFLLRGKLRALRQRTVNLAGIQPGQTVLDVGCGTGTLVIEVQRRVGATGRARGIDPGPQQIARARAKAARHNLPSEFQLGVIEQLAFPDQTFDVVLSTLMMHHLPKDLKRRGFAEIARVLKPGGCLVVADFTRPPDRGNRPSRFGAGGSNVDELAVLVQDAGFSHVETDEMPLPRFPAHEVAGVCFVRAQKV
jgi:ubiquinone/menaquinone biosynthesis C-methylase UbiE